MVLLNKLSSVAYIIYSSYYFLLSTKAFPDSSNPEMIIPDSSKRHEKSCNIQVLNTHGGRLMSATVDFSKLCPGKWDKISVKIENQESGVQYDRYESVDCFSLENTDFDKYIFFSDMEQSGSEKSKVSGDFNIFLISNLIWGFLNITDNLFQY